MGSRVAQFALIGLGSAALGFALGQMTAHRDATDTLETNRAPSTEEQRSNRVTGHSFPRLPFSPTDRAPEASAPDTSDVDTTDVEQLRARVRELEEELGFHRGRAAEAPRDLPERFGREQLLERLNRAMADADTGGEIILVDCDEYPCIACGTLPEQAGEEPDINADLQALMRAAKSPAIEVYSDDGKAASVSTTRRSPEGAPVVRHQTSFCQSYFAKPEQPEQEDQLKKRIDVRIGELLDSLQ